LLLKSFGGFLLYYFVEVFDRVGTLRRDDFTRTADTGAFRQSAPQYTRFPELRPIRLNFTDFEALAVPFWEKTYYPSALHGMPVHERGSSRRPETAASHARYVEDEMHLHCGIDEPDFWRCEYGSCRHEVYVEEH